MRHGAIDTDTFQLARRGPDTRQEPRTNFSRHGASRTEVDVCPSSGVPGGTPSLRSWLQVPSGTRPVVRFTVCSGVARL